MSTYTRMGTITTTVIVSREPDRSGNFICDGTADDVQINAAIVYVGVLGGGSVTILHGTYNLAAQIVDGGYNDILLEGVGWTTYLFAITNLNASPIYISNVSGWIIQNLKVDANKDNQTVDLSAIFFDTVTNPIIDHVRVLGGHRYDTVRGEGIEYLDCTNGIIAFNYVTAADYDCIKLGRSPNGCVGCIVISNQIVTPSDDTNCGIQISGPTGANNILANNTINCQGGNNTGGIVIHYADRNTVIGNTIFGTPFAGLNLVDGADNNLFVNNYVYNATYGAAWNTGAPEGNTFIGNYIVIPDGVAYGFSAQVGTNQTIWHNTIVGFDEESIGIHILAGATDTDISHKNKFLGSWGTKISDAGTTTRRFLEEVHFFLLSEDQLDDTATEYNSIFALRQYALGNFVEPNWTTEARTKQRIPFGYRPLYVLIMLGGPPGAGNSYTFTLRDDGAGTACVLVIAGTDTSAEIFYDSGVGPLVAAWSQSAWQCVPADTPTAQMCSIFMIVEKLPP